MEPYPRPAFAPRPPPQRRRSLQLGCFSWTLAAVLTIITGYFGMAVYRLKDDAATGASVTSSFLRILVLLLCCLLLLKERAAGAAWRGRLKAYVCALATLLYFHVAYMAMGAAALTLSIALLVWFMPAAAWAGFFVYSAFNCRGRAYQPPDETMLLLPV